MAKLRRLLRLPDGERHRPPCCVICPGSSLQNLTMRSALRVWLGLAAAAGIAAALSGCAMADRDEGTMAAKKDGSCCGGSCCSDSQAKTEQKPAKAY